MVRRERRDQDLRHVGFACAKCKRPGTRRLAGGIAYRTRESAMKIRIEERQLSASHAELAPAREQGLGGAVEMADREIGAHDEGGGCKLCERGVQLGLRGPRFRQSLLDALCDRDVAHK